MKIVSNNGVVTTEELTQDDLDNQNAKASARLASAKADKIAEIDRLAARALRQGTVGYDQSEIATWDSLKSVAWDVIKRNVVSDTITDKIAGTGETAEEYATRILNNNINCSKFSNDVIANRNLLKENLDPLTNEQALTFDADAGWPTFSETYVSQATIDAMLDYPVKIVPSSTFYDMLTKAKVQTLHGLTSTDLEVAYLMTITSGVTELDRTRQNYIDGIDYLETIGQLTAAQATYMKTSNDFELTITGVGA